ncbi:hypothetical protein [Janibacter sp. G56]|uniref:hypothetical protein n=1 Tax=Janibacter sp. G56 TaxID=3418717 RepID=UPI003D0195A8
MASTRRPATRRRTSLDRTHRVGVVISAILGLAGLLGVIVGAWSWTLERPAATQVQRTAGASLASTPWFDQGYTLFADEASMADADASGAAEEPRASGARTWGCVLVRNGRETPLTSVADIEVTGSRVHAGRALLPALNVGESATGDRVSCPRAPVDSEIWALPTNAGVPLIPLSLIVGGIAAAGAAALTHPRSRGVARFGS